MTSNNNAKVLDTGFFMNFGIKVEKNANLSKNQTINLKISQDIVGYKKCDV